MVTLVDLQVLWATLWLRGGDGNMTPLPKARSDATLQALLDGHATYPQLLPEESSTRNIAMKSPKLGGLRVRVLGLGRT